MARLAVAFAFVALIAVASAQAVASKAPAGKQAAPFAGRKAAGAFCRHSCYPLPKTTPASTCQSVVAQKTKTLKASGIPFNVDGFSCTSKATTGCDVLMLQSWPSQAVHDQYQVAEDKVPTLAAMRANLPSTSIKGFAKSGLCATFKTPIA